MKYIFLVVWLLLPFSAFSSESEVWVESGKGSGVRTINLFSEKNLSDNYTSILFQIDRWSFPPEYWKKEQLTQSEIDSLPAKYKDPEYFVIKEYGVWEKHYTIFEVTNSSIGHKAILLKDAFGNYRMLYAQAESSAVDLDKEPQIHQINGISVLEYDVNIAGTGNYSLNLYWVLNINNDPILLDISVINDTLNQVLPKRHSAWKGGVLDLAALRYSSPVWRDGDSNCCPSGGNVYMLLSLRDQTLSVQEVHYAPEE